MILSFFTCVIVTPGIFLMLWCRKTSSLFRSDTHRYQILYPHSRTFMRMARKIKYLLRRSTYVSFQKGFDALIADELEASLLSKSELSQILFGKSLQNIWSYLWMLQSRLKLCWFINYNTTKIELYLLFHILASIHILIFIRFVLELIYLSVIWHDQGVDNNPLIKSDFK